MNVILIFKVVYYNWACSCFNDKPIWSRLQCEVLISPQKQKCSLYDKNNRSQKCSKSW